jgi:hypothetical protein
MVVVVVVVVVVVDSAGLAPWRHRAHRLRDEARLTQPRTIPQTRACVQTCRCYRSGIREDESRSAHKESACACACVWRCGGVEVCVSTGSITGKSGCWTALWCTALHCTGTTPIERSPLAGEIELDWPEFRTPTTTALCSVDISIQSDRPFFCGGRLLWVPPCRTCRRLELCSAEPSHSWACTDHGAALGHSGG